LYRLNLLTVMTQERQVGINLGRHQSLAQEQCAGLHGINAAKVNATTTVNRQAVQGSAFVGYHLASFLLPTRIAPGFTQQMGANFFNPLRLDTRHTAGKESRGFHQLASQNPAACFLDRSEEHTSEL